MAQTNEAEAIEGGAKGQKTSAPALEALSIAVDQHAAVAADAIRSLKETAVAEGATALAEQRAQHETEVAPRLAAASLEGERKGRATALAALAALGGGVPDVPAGETAGLLADGLSYDTLPEGYPRLELATSGI